ncbi:MAG: hypothetical protein K5707_05870 [Clostridia bacterium]|nr:hypothetical protein [Clostridia bacterium]
MGSTEILSLVGILIGITVLIILAYKRVNIIFYSILASVIVLLFSGQGGWTGITTTLWGALRNT